MFNKQENEAAKDVPEITWWARIKELLLLVVIFFLLRGTVVQAFVIPSSSMFPTLQIGDHLLVNKLSYGIRLFGFTETLYNYSKPERNDIIVFTNPDDPETSDIDESDIYLIKRVVGLPGEKIQVKQAKVYINDQVLEEANEVNWQNGGIGGDFGPVIIPEDKFLMLGDNRDFSRDSRFWSDPFLPLKRIEGRAFVMYWPRFGGI